MLALCINDFPSFNSCQWPQIVAALSTLRLARMGNRVYKIRKSTETRSHKKIHTKIFFFLGRPRKALFAEELSGNHQSVASLFERSARHPPAHTMQIFVKTRASIPRLSIENPV